MSTLTGSVEELMTPQLIDRLSARSGVPRARVRVGVDGAVASILDGLATKAHDPRAMRRVAELVHDGAPLDDEETRRSSSQLLDVVGADSPSFVSRVAGYTGVGVGAAAGFIGAAATLVMDAFRSLGRARGGLDADALSATLIDEQPELHAAVPSRLLHEDADVDRARGAPIDFERRRGTWLMPVLLLGGLIAVVALWAGRRHGVPTAALSQADDGSSAAAFAQARGTTLVFPSGSAPAKLVEELKHPGAHPAWIDLDAHFDVGQPTLLSGSSDQLAPIAQVLAAFPQARVRIAGYADAEESSGANTSLSWARADAVRDELIRHGVDASRIEARGFGQRRADDGGMVTRSNKQTAIQVVPPS